MFCRLFLVPLFDRSLSAFVIILFLLTGFSAGQTPTPESTPEIPTIEIHKPVQRDISGAQRHNFQIKLAAGEYAKIRLEQRGIDLGLRLYGTDGKTLADFDVEFQLTASEIAEFVAPAAGVYRFDVINKFPYLPAGKYELTVADLRPATERDKLEQEARSLNITSIRSFNAGKYAEARTAVEQALGINRKALGPENQTVVLNLTQLARIAEMQGEYAEAEKINREALAIEGRIFVPDHPHTANTLNYLAVLYSRREEYPQAIEYHQRALAMRERIFGKVHPQVAASLINLGVVYNYLGDRLKAIEVYQRALDVQERTAGLENFNAAVVFNNIGDIYNNLEEYQKAQPFLQKAVDILEKIYPPENPRIYEALTHLAISYAGMKQLDTAQALFQRILAAREKILGANHPRTAEVNFNLGNLSMLKNEPDKAEAFYGRALEVRENKFGGESSAVSEVLSALALLKARQGQIEQALKFQQRSNAIDERSIGLNLTIGSERQKLAYLNSLFERTNQSFLLQTEFAPDSPLAVELALTTVLRQKGRVLDAVARNLTELRSRGGQQDRELLDRLNKITQQIAELILKGAGETSIAEHQAKIKTLQDERERLEDEISRRVAGFFPVSRPVTVASVGEAIPPDSALLEFVAYTPSAGTKESRPAKQRYLVYILSHDGKIRWKDLGETEAIDAAITAFRQALRDPQRKDLPELARALDEKLMQPVRPLLGEFKKLFISPDGALNLIPFESLLDENRRFLIENYAFTYLTSGRDLLRMQTPRTNTNKPLLVANPTFGPPDSMRLASLKINPRETRRQSVTATRSLSETYFAPLRNTIEEVRSIRTLFPEAELVTDEKASETALKQVAAPRILHIATHGFFLEDRESKSNNGENPLLRSGLALAGANQLRGGQDDGILTALEASGLNLWGTKLVVLSACDTGVGEVRNGEGVYGLRRAFILGGAEALVMSLWPVSDLVARELMTQYYKNLKGGKGRADALRHVQLEMIKKPNRQHPFYWASFIHFGDWANLDGQR